jgi:hypothetical protein
MCFVRKEDVIIACISYHQHLTRDTPLLPTFRNRRICRVYLYLLGEMTLDQGGVHRPVRYKSQTINLAGLPAVPAPARRCLRA